MKASLAFCLLGFYFAFLIQNALSKPIEIIYRGGDCPCAGREQKEGCEHGVLQGYGYGSISPGRGFGSGGCSAPRYRISPGNTQVKYIFDYNVEIPVEARQVNIPLTDLFARVDKILVDTGSAKVVNTDCTCTNKKAVAAGLVAPCPVIPARACGLRHNHIARYGINFIPSDGGFLSHSMRSRRSIHKKKIHQKKHAFGKLLKSDKSKRSDKSRKHKIQKRQIARGSLIEESASNFKKQYKYPEVIQYFPEVLSSNLQPGQCFTCCASKRKGSHSAPYELLCEPQSVTVKTSSGHYVKQMPVTSEAISISIPTSEARSQQHYHDSHGDDSLVELVEPSQLGTDNTFRDYMKSVVYSHNDFLNAEGSGTELVESEETQRADARLYIQKLIEDQLARSGDSRFTREYPSPPLEIIPSSTHENDNSFLIKLTQTPSQGDNRQKRMSPKA